MFNSPTIWVYIASDASMASCGYSKYVSGVCGGSSESPGSDLCVRIAECCKDIKGHLKTYGVSDATLSSEARLLLARAGKLNSNRVTLEFHLTRISTA